MIEAFAAFQDFIRANELEGLLRAGIIITLTLAVSVAVRALLRRIRRRTDNSRMIFLRVLPQAVALPLQAIIWLGAAEVIFRSFKDVRDVIALDEVDTILAIGYLAIVTLGLMSLNQRYFRAQRDAYIRGDLVGLDLGNADLLRKVLVVLIFAGAVLVALPIFGVSIGGLLAVGGIGGAIAGFAVKDTLANVLGSIMINIDRPFRVGDWVRLPSHDIEGVVEEIGWGQTTIRKFDKRPVYVPNSMIGNVLIENPGRMTHRRIREQVAIRYSDFDKLPAVIESIQAYVRGHPDLDQKQTPVVRFVSYGAYSLDIEVTAYTTKTAWLDFLAVHQGVLVEIGKIIARHGAQIAVPTQVLQMSGGAADANPPPLPVGVAS